MNKLEVTGWFEWHLLFKKIVFLKLGFGLTFNLLELKINLNIVLLAPPFMFPFQSPNFPFKDLATYLPTEFSIHFLCSCKFKVAVSFAKDVIFPLLDYISNVRISMETFPTPEYALDLEYLVHTCKCKWRRIPSSTWDNFIL